MNERLIKVSKVVFDIWFWVALAGVVALLVVVPFVPTLMDAILDSTGTEVSTRFLGATIEIDLGDLATDKVTSLGWVVLSTVAFGLGVSAYIVHQIRRALGSVLEGAAFRQENFGRLRRMSYAIFVMVPIAWISNTWAESIISGHFAPKIDLQIGTIAAGLLVLSISEIYKAGVTLQDESELTV